MRADRGPVDLDASSGAALGSLRSLGEILFRSTVWARRTLYGLGLRRVHKVDCPVISVGNLTVGGNGKTPFTIYLANKIEETGRRVTVLSRGYGGQWSRRSRAPLLVSDEGQIQAPARIAGDEPVLIGLKTRASVVVSSDRVRAARFAVEMLGADALLLDDGFQHWRLARDLDILLLDAQSPFGNGHLLPAGSLREPREALERAHLVVLNQGVRSFLPRPEEAPLPAGLPRVSIGVVPTSVGPLLGGLREPAATIEGHRVALLAAIARPERFEAMVRGLGVKEVVARRFLRDHAPIDEKALDAFLREARGARAEILLTTEKDAVRLVQHEGAAQLWTLAIEPVLLSGEAELERALVRALAGRSARGSGP